MQKFIQHFIGEKTPYTLEPIAQAGSDRQYYRLFANEKKYIVCVSSNVKENNSFFYFAQLFKEYTIPVPTIYAINDTQTIYILEDVGHENLLDTVLAKGHTEDVKLLYKKSLNALANLQIDTAQKVDYTKCYGVQQFDKYAVLADLNYFKYYFLDFQSIEYNKYDLQKEFETFSNEIEKIKPHYFMYRDFQGRNIMIQHETPHFIDFQGGMKGPLQYDVASLLWQAKATLPADWKKELLDYYIQCVSSKINLNETEFRENYSFIVLIRLLQVLGAYGLRGVIEKKQHFISSIPFGLQNLKEWKNENTLSQYPVLETIIHQITQTNFIEKFK